MPVKNNGESPYNNDKHMISQTVVGNGEARPPPRIVGSVHEASPSKLPSDPLIRRRERDKRSLKQYILRSCASSYRGMNVLDI